MDKPSAKGEALFNVADVKKTIVDQRLFDQKWYCNRYSLGSLEGDILADEFLSGGVQKGRNPNPLFDAEYYARHNMQGDQTGLPPFIHYLMIGAARSSWPHPLVDITFVAEQLTQLGVSDMPLTALLHKCTALNLDPHPTFSVRYYFLRYPELRGRRVHPIIHYLENGAREGRAPHPLFWPEWFKDHMPKAPEHPARLLTSYLQDASLFRVDPNPFFDANYYVERYPDLAAANINLLYHYLRFGQFEKRTPNKALDPDWVESNYRRQLSVTKMDPLSFLILNDNGYVSANEKGLPLEKNGTVSAKDLVHLPTAATQAKTNKKKPKRILFISHNFKIQGAQTSLFELAVGIKNKFNCHVQVISPDDGPMKTQYKSEHVDVGKYALPVNGLPDVKQYDKLFSYFEAQILAAKPDVVHGNTIQAYHAMAIAARHGIATVWNIRESEEPASHGSDFHEGASLLLKEAIKTAQQYVFVSNSTRGIWEQAFPGIKAAVIQNGIDYNRLTLPYRVGQRPLARAAYGIKQDEIMLLSVGTWTERKGQIDFVDALKKIDCRLWPRIRVVLIGATDTPYGAIIRNSIESAPAALRDRIMVDHETSGLAQRARVLQAYAAADVFVFTSRIESYPRVVSEAMFYGLPIIATPCFGVVEQLEAGVSASFYQPGAIDHLASLLQQLITNAETRLRLSAAAKSAALNKVIQYPEMLERYYEIHSNLVA